MLPDTKYTATIASPTWPLHATTLYKCNSWPRLVEGWMCDCFCTIFLANGQQTVATVKCESNSSRDQAHQNCAASIQYHHAGTWGPLGQDTSSSCRSWLTPGRFRNHSVLLRADSMSFANLARGHPKWRLLQKLGGAKMEVG